MRSVIQEGCFAQRYHPNRRTCTSAARERATESTDLQCPSLRLPHAIRRRYAQIVARAPRELLLGRWRACFLLDSTATSRRPAIHTTCGTITVRSLGDSVP